jgi:hypothetical protein
MDTQPAQSEQVTTSIGAFYQWADTPVTVALIFGLAGAIFIGIYAIRRVRAAKSPSKQD